jgi:hypothetical protein
MNEEMLNLLIRSFDENLSEVERTSLDKALAGSPELREEKKQLFEMRQMIGETAERKFKPFFSSRVMHRIEESQTEQENFFDSLVWAFRLFAMAGAAAIVLFFALNSKLANDLSIDSILGLPQLSIEDTWQLQNLIEEDANDN